MALRGGLGVVHRECLLVRASALTHGADHYRDWGSGVLALAQTGLAKIPGSYRSSKPLGLSSDRCMLAKHSLVLWHPQLRSFPFQPLVKFFDHGRRPLVVDLPGRVLAFAKHLVTPLVHEVRHLGLVNHFLSKLRRDECHAFNIT